MAPSPASMRWKYFSISRDTPPSAVMHTGADFSALERRTSKTLSPKASFTKSSTGLLASAFFSFSAFSSSLSGRASAAPASLKGFSPYAPRVWATNSSTSSVK